MTSLSKQLTSLKLSQGTTQDISKNDKERASILFTAKDAAGISVEKIFYIGLEAHKGLTKVAPALYNFQQELFSLERKNIDREKLTEDQNTELSNMLKKVMILMADHMQNENCLKVMEYQLRNFNVHIYEPEALIINFLPFHATPAYIRLLQNLDLKSTNSWTHFLNNVVKKGDLISRELIVNQIMYDTMLLERCINVVREMTELSLDLSKNPTYYVVGRSNAVKTFNSSSQNFLTAIIVESINLSQKKSAKLANQISKLCLIYISWALGMSKEQCLSSVMIITSNMIRLGSISTKHLKAVMYDLLAVRVENLGAKNKERYYMNILKLVLYCFQTVEDFKFTKKMFNQLSNEDLHTKQKCLELISQDFSVMNFVSSVFQLGCANMNITSKNSDFQHFLRSVLSSVSQYDRDYLNDYVLRKVFLDNIFQKIDFKSEDSNYLIIIFREVFSDEFSASVTRFLKKIQQDDQNLAKVVYSRIEKIFSYQIFDSVIQIAENQYSKEDMGLSWPIAMIDPNKKSRIAALNYLENKAQLFSKISKAEIEKIKRCLFNRLKCEDNSYIVGKMLTMGVWGSILSKDVDESQICNICVSTGQKWAYMPEIIEKLSQFIHKYIPVSSKELKNSKLTDNEKLSIQILIWSNDKSKNDWINKTLQNSDSFNLLTLSEEFQFNKNLLHDFIIELLPFVQLNLVENKTDGLDGFIQWLLKLRQSIKIDLEDFCEKLIDLCVELLTSTIKKAFKTANNLKMNYYTLKIVECCFNLSKPIILKNQNSEPETVRESENQDYKERDIFLNKFETSLRFRLVVHCLKLFNNDYFQNVDNRNLCRFMVLLLTGVSLDEEIGISSQSELENECNLLSMKMPYIPAEFRENVLKILKHFTYYLKAKLYKTKNSESEFCIFTQVLTENFNLVSKPDILSIRFIEKLNEAQSNISNYIEEVSKELSERNYAKNYHVNFLQKFMENCKKLKIKFDMMNTLKNLIKIYETKIDNLNVEQFSILRDLYILCETNKEKDQLKKFFEKVFSNDRTYSNDSLTEFFKILENQEFTKSKPNCVQYIFKIFLDLFVDNKVNSLINLASTENVFNMLSKAILKNINDERKLSICLRHIPDLLGALDVTNLDEKEILFVISVVEVLRYLIIEKVVTDNSQQQRLVFKLLDTCFETMKTCPKIAIVASNLSISENAKHFDEKSINWHENHHAFSDSLKYNTKKELYFYPINKYFEENMLEYLKQTLVSSMKFFVNSKLKASQSDADEDLTENLDDVTKYFDKSNNVEQDQEEDFDNEDSSIDGSLAIEVIRNCCKVILTSSKLNKSVAFETIKESMKNLMTYIKNTKEDLLAKRSKNDYVLIETENNQTSEEVILLQQLESSTIYQLNLCVKLLNEVQGKKLEIFGDLLIMYQNFIENLTSNGLLRNLSLFYNLRAKDIKQRLLLNPMLDTKILEISQRLKYIYKTAFNDENLDYFISIMLNHFVTNNEQMDNNEKVENKKKDEIISLTDYSLYIVKLMQSFVLSDNEKLSNKYQADFVLLIQNFMSDFSKIITGFQDKSTKINFKSNLLNKNLSNSGDTKSSQKSLTLTQVIFYDRLISHKEIIEAINNQFIIMLKNTSNDNKNENEEKLYEPLVIKFSSFMKSIIELYYNIDKLKAIAGIEVNKLKGEDQDDSKFKKKESLHKFYIRVSNLQETMIEKLAKVFSGESLSYCLYKNYSEELKSLQENTIKEFNFTTLKKQVEIVNNKIFAIGTTNIFKFLIFNFLECVYSSFEVISTSNSTKNEKFYQAIFVFQSQAYDKFPKKIEDFFQEKNLIDKVSECVKGITSPEIKSFGLYALSKFCLRKNFIFLEIINEFLPEVFNLFGLYLSKYNYEGWCLIKDEDKLKQNYIRATKNKTLSLEKYEKEGATIKTNDNLIENLQNILSNLIPSLGSILSPYIQSILQVLCLVHEKSLGVGKFAQKGLDILALNVEIRQNLVPIDMLLDIILLGTFSKSVQLLESLSYFCKQLFGQLTQHTFIDYQKDLFKIIKKGFQACLLPQSSFESEVHYNEIVDNWISVWMRFVVKCSEMTLKKYFNVLVKWAKFNEEDYGDTEEDMQKKILFVKMFISVVKGLGSFSINYYAFVYEYYIGFLEDCHKKWANKDQKLGKKRKFSELEPFNAHRITLHKLVLESLSLCFINDQNDFIDVFKFEKLIQPLAKQLELHRLEQEIDFVDYTKKNLVPCIINLFDLVSDDYKWKTQQHAVLERSNHENSKVRFLSIVTINALVDKLKEGYIVLFNDLMPYLTETLDDEDSEVAAISKLLATLLEALTGEDIKEYIRRGDMDL